jgi:hypothetical protein
MDRSFKRKLEQLVLDRLRAGQPAEALLAELKTRMGDAEADTLLSRAEARFARRRTPPGTLATRILAGFAYLWTGVLVLQNVAILMTIGEIARSGLAPPSIMLFPVLKIGLLLTLAVAFQFRRSAITAALYAGAILYAFPFGLFVDRLVASFGDPPDPAILTTVSALLSYVAALLVGLIYWLGRRDGPRVAGVEAFD